MGRRTKQLKRGVVIFTLVVILLFFILTFIGSVLASYFAPTVPLILLSLLAFIVTMAIFYVLLDVIDNKQ